MYPEKLHDVVGFVFISATGIDMRCTNDGNAPLIWRQLTRHILTRLAYFTGKRCY
ncbi:hypothetical protein C4J93_4827 [Pseudomonas sp. R2-37-08W]|nr:hypothetical protein C4J93_4827 [Pseudomonas sp. R2-37-08W]AZF39629.1 hypothetical protein C4J88_4895 [Pseudomonas sp. R4-39-08]